MYVQNADTTYIYDKSVIYMLICKYHILKTLNAY